MNTNGLQLQRCDYLAVGLADWRVAEALTPLSPVGGEAASPASTAVTAPLPSALDRDRPLVGTAQV